MFYLNISHNWKFGSTMEDVDNAILLPSGICRLRLLRTPRLELQRVLFDPQLYLSNLDSSKCTLTCSRLASYPWFNTGEIPNFDNQTMSRREWDKKMQEHVSENWRISSTIPEDIFTACSECIDFQINCSCSQIILPTPLITEKADEVQLQADWLDQGIKAAQELEAQQPLLATVAIDEKELANDSFSASGLLENIIDQVKSRDEIGGVYIVIVQTHWDHPFHNSDLVVKAYLYLSRFFGSIYDTVVVNFADLAGLACMGIGATSFSTGNSQNLRRLSFENFKERSGGKAYPHFYSHKSASEFLTEKELDKIRDKKLIRRIFDKTPHSQILMDTLIKGDSASALIAWAEGQNNLEAAQKHYIARIAQEHVKIRKLSLAERQNSIRNWLEDADVNQVYLESKGINGTFAPAGHWLATFEGVVNI